MENHGAVYYVYHLHPYSGNIYRRLSGKFFLDEDGAIHVLEDHSGNLSELETMEPDKAVRYIQNLQDSMYTEVVDADDIASGHRPDLVEQIPTSIKEEKEEQSPVSYKYHRVGMEAPQELTFQDGKAALDGYDLSDLELGKMIENVRSGKAEIQKTGMVDSKIKKQQSIQLNLIKSEDLFNALNSIRSAVKSGALHPDVLKTLSGHIFKDTMLPSMGNKKAYEDFIQRPRKGVHVHLDLNDFGSINKMHGHDVGDSAIKAAGNAIRSAMDESVGRAYGKLFRKGGDEFVAFVPSHEHAARFVRHLNQTFGKIPPIKGTHSISTSIGVGENPETAEHGLIQAKTAKKAAAYPLGQSKTHAYSAISGFEGHLATE
jgi:diguanylate cyclase (GGDEF)-like protein